MVADTNGNSASTSPSGWQTLVSNLPYACMIALGTAAIWLSLRASPWSGPVSLAAAGAYAAYGVLGTLWIIVFLCPYCSHRRSCPCGYGRIAEALRGSQEPELSLFRRKFRLHIPVIVPLWFIPLAYAGRALALGFDPVIASLAAAFAVDAFLVLPLVSKRRSCSTCEQKEDCPWMKTADAPSFAKATEGSVLRSSAGAKGDARACECAGEGACECAGESAGACADES